MSGNQRGGRLIELLVIVLAIVTLVATVALPETRAFLGLDGNEADNSIADEADPDPDTPAPTAEAQATAPLADVTSDDVERGMLINAVEPDSPADVAGFPIDGWLISLAGEPIKNNGTAQSIAQANQGVPITAVIRYNDELMELEITPSDGDSLLGVDLCKPVQAVRCRAQR
jgi:S1-C subfamily serine protease